MANEQRSFPSAPEYGRSLKGVGINILVRDLDRELAFLREVFGLEPRHREGDFAIMSHDGQDWMLHGDSTYHSHPLLAFLGDGAPRGLGVELRLYGLDPKAAEERARAGGHEILAAPAHKPHGLYECYIFSPAGYLYVASVHSFEKG
jgi:catechol 2,3-dioxygenase-like lactoylglutathione lyase family enzyme